MAGDTTPMLPSDDPQRTLALNSAEDGLHLSLAGDTYTILLSGEETAGRYCLIDMFIPPGGGPPPHRHDFEESFTVIEGEIVATFRGEEVVVQAGRTINIPANAPHAFTNAAAHPARLLCICAPAGQDAFFLALGDRVASRTAPPPVLDDTARAARIARAEALAPRYRTELLRP